MKLLLTSFISTLPQQIIIGFPFSDSLFVGEKEHIIIESNKKEEYIFPELSVENEDISISGKRISGNSAIYNLYFWNNGEFTFPSLNIINDIDTLKTEEFIFNVYNSQNSGCKYKSQ